MVAYIVNDVREGSPACASGPSVDVPSLEVVHFPDFVSQHLEADDDTPVAQVALATEGDFVNTSQGASPGSMETGVIHNSPNYFVHLMAKLLQSVALTSPPVHHHHPRCVYTTSEVPRHCSHLAKKASSRVPVVAAAQNILMRKLGLATGTHVESEDFNRYLKAFKDGLTEEHVKLIRELFNEHASDPAGSLVAEEAD
jgi:hypothetical protein